jgi:hypothetical protein
VTSALRTLGVFMAHATAHGNVTVSLDGAVCYVTKVISSCNCSTVFLKCQVWVYAGRRKSNIMQFYHVFTALGKSDWPSL